MYVWHDDRDAKGLDTHHQLGLTLVVVYMFTTGEVADASFSCIQDNVTISWYKGQEFLKEIPGHRLVFY